MNVAAPETTAWTYGNYYNYDWGWDDQITTAYHEIELTFWPMDSNNMVGNVEFEHHVAGEDSGALIENDVEIDYFNYY